MLNIFAWLGKNRKPTPPRNRKSSKYPFANLQVGESITFKKAEANRVRSSAWYYAKKHDIKFSSVTKKTTVKLWRIA